MFGFSHHPTAITASDGIQDAFRFLQTSWRKWLPAVVVMSACAFVVYALVGPFDPRALYHTDPVTGRAAWNPDAASKLEGAVLTAIATSAVGFVASWLFNATAVAGLRNRPVTVAYVIGRGLIAFVADLILLFATLGGVVVIATLFAATPAVGILASIAVVPPAVYLWIRVVFTTLAVFDGFGPIEAIEESWRLSSFSVQRLFGWGVLAAVITFATGIVGVVVAAPLSVASGLAPLAQAVSALVSGAGSVLIVYMMAVLYESERARKDPTLYPVPAFMGYGAGGPPPYAPGPYPARPYAPGPYTTGPYAGGPDGPVPAWPSQPQSQPYDPSQWQANPQGGWVGPVGPAPAWATDPTAANPEPPADPDPATQPPETPAS